MKKKYQIFLSSTYKDLRSVRRIATKTILKAGCIPTGMELFPPTSQKQWELIKGVINQSDYYVLIIGWKYGSEINGISYTQKEYRYAVKKKKKIIALIHSDKDKVAPSKIEVDQAKIDKLEKFKSEVMDYGLINHWNDENEVSGLIYHGIDSLRKKYPATGWIKATRYNLNKLSSKKHEYLNKQNKSLQQKYNELEARIKSSKKDNEPELKQNLKILVTNKILELDKKVNKIVPEKILSGTKNKDESFSSLKLINSLTQIGIDIDVCLEVLELAISELLLINQHVPQLTTAHIRQAISSSLYKIDNSTYKENQIKEWGHSYIRKYGDPKKRICVIHDKDPTNIRVFTLSFQYLKNEFIPNLATFILGEEVDRDFFKLHRNNEDSRIAEKVISLVKKMDIYNIHYSILVSMIKEIAIQPPHPWIVQFSFNKESIQYQYERATIHVKKIHSSQLEGINNIMNHSIKECIYHSSSGILATYGVYMGCKFMNSFYILIQCIDDLRTGNVPLHLGYSSVDQLAADFKKLDIDLLDFSRMLNQIKDILNRLKTKKITIIELNTVISLYTIFESIVKHYKFERFAMD